MKGRPKEFGGQLRGVFWDPLGLRYTQSLFFFSPGYFFGFHFFLKNLQVGTPTHPLIGLNQKIRNTPASMAQVYFFISDFDIEQPDRNMRGFHPSGSLLDPRFVFARQVSYLSSENKSGAQQRPGRVKAPHITICISRSDRFKCWLI